MERWLKRIGETAERYRPKPFFTLNDTPDESALRRKVREMKEVGLGGFYVHARSGLGTDYLGEAWFASVDILVEEAEANGMECWIYDEFGWPSGIAGGKVLDRSSDFYVKWLQKNPDPAHPVGRVLAKSDGAEGAYTIEAVSNRGYVDVLNLRATEEFLKVGYEPYYRRYGNRICGFFTDEPQYGLLKLPYTDGFEARYSALCGRNFAADLPLLFEERGEWRTVREAFFRTASALFSEHYVRPVAAWCEERGYRLTGHLLEEKSLSLQIRSAGNLMELYRSFQYPGMDWLGKAIGEDFIPRQVASVRKQFGKARTVAECFALVGYGASFDEMKHITDWENMNGITDICNIYPYGVRGRRKRDYPAGILSAQPYYPYIRNYNDYLARLGALVGTAEERADVLLVQPLLAAMRRYREDLSGALRETDDAFIRVARTLSGQMIGYDLTNDLILPEAQVVGQALQLGERRYRALVLCGEDADSPAVKTAEAFAAAGGAVFVFGGYCPKGGQKCGAVLPEALKRGRVCAVAGGEGALRAVRYEDGDRFMVILKNRENRPIEGVRASVDGRELNAEVDLVGLTVRPVSRLQFLPFETKILTVTERSALAVQSVSVGSEGFRLVSATPNALLLDRCEYSLNGAPFCTASAVIRLFEKLIRDGENGNLVMRFPFTVKALPAGKVWVALESHEQFTVSLNGVRAESVPDGTYLDGSMALMDVTKALRQGENCLELDCRYFQHERAREILLGIDCIESDFNMLSKLFELENCFLIGNFGVSAPLRQTGGCLSASGGFAVDALPRVLASDRPAETGFPFFAGKIVLEKEFDYRRAGEANAVLHLTVHRAVVRVFVNGAFVRTILWNEGGTDVTPFVREGVNTLRLEIFNTLRNAFGPHHNRYGDPGQVGFTTFSGEPGWCDPPGADMWTDEYRLVSFGVEAE